MDLLHIADLLVADLQDLHFSDPVTHVYNPLDYARAPYELYVKRYGRGRREVVLLGMNPGPWGMLQTGVPFGEVNKVRDWLGIDAFVGKPPHEHPKRPVQGFACKRSEVSGTRLWGWAQDAFGTPKRFFQRFFVVNYCPLAFFDAVGRNITPDRLPVKERKALAAACDAALRRTIETFKPRYVIGVGRFAASRAEAALKGLDVTVGGILHPSPASPAANQNWAAKATAQLESYGIEWPRGASARIRR